MVIYIMVGRFSSKARGCILGYIYNAKKDKEKVNDNKPMAEWSFEMNKQKQKIYQSHRDTNTIDRVFNFKVIIDVISVKLEPAEVKIYDNIFAR